MRTSHQAIVLRRTDYGEGDRIINLLTPDLGKISVLAKGVRKPRSKLAGGVEPFSLLSVSLLRGRSELYTLVSSQMQQHYDLITEDYERLTLGYQILKKINQAAESLHEPAMFELLQLSLAAVGDSRVDSRLAEAWFHLHFIRLLGLGLNTLRDASGRRLQADKRYNFSISDMAFVEHPSGDFGADALKLLRLMESQPPAVLARVGGIEAVLPAIAGLLRTLDE